MTAIESEAGPVIGHIQTDTFCEGCGYNLHTQPVMRDARLGILIARCPECGRFNAAGRTAAASQPWLNRLGIALLLGWIAFLLLFFGLVALFLGITAYSHAFQGTTYQAVQRPMPGTSGPMVQAWERVIDQRTNKTPEEVEREREEAITLAIVATSFSLIAGAAFSTFLWHCRGVRRLAVFLLPLVACGLAYVTWLDNGMMIHLRGWGRRRIGEYLAWEAAWVLIGLLIGRPIARGALSVLLPPKLRQHLAFLWTRDGKRLSIQSES